MQKERLKFFCFIILLIILTVGLITISHFLFDFLHDEHLFGDGDSNIVKINAAVIIVLTSLLVYTAYHQLKIILKQIKDQQQIIKDQKEIAQSQFLLKIDERFGSPTIVKAKTILHKIYINTKIYNNQKITGKLHTNEMGKCIVDLRDSVDKASDFTHLMSLLNLLETLSYFANRNKISESEVEDLLQGSLLYYYDVFEAWIFERRNKYKDDRYYAEFEGLVKKFRDKNINK